MTKTEGESNNEGENQLKTKALGLIAQMYEMAGERKSVNNLEGESQIMLIVSGMEKMVETLEILSKEEVAAIKNEYWVKRDKIPLDFPDRF